MTPTLTMDYRAFNVAVERKLVETKMTINEVLKQQSRLFVQDVSHLTPPTGKRPFDETFNEQRGWGNRAVESDLRKIFKRPSDLPAIEPRVQAWLDEYARRGDTEKIKTVLTRLKTKWQVVPEATAALHKINRGSGGRTLRTRKYLVTNVASIKRLILEVQKRVGMAKAGWAAAANKTGFHLPAWITRHSQPGQYIEHLNTTVPSITIANLVGFAQKHNRTARVIQRALNHRAEKMHKAMDGALKAQFNKYR